MDGAHEVGIELRLDEVEWHVLDRTHAGEAGIVHKDVDQTEALDGRLDHLPGPDPVGNIEPMREKAVGESRREIVQRGGVSGRGDDIVACGQRGLHDRTSQADRTACDEPSIVHIPSGID